MNDAELALGRGERNGAVGAWLSTERVAYGAATLAALFVRLFDLGLSPLGPAEAAQALPAWQAAGGHAYALTGVSPLLFGLQRWLFTPLGGGDGLARWWPAALGGLATLLFYALRERLGRGGALIAALLWALSPLVVFTNRLGLGYGLAPTFALALVAALSLAASGEAKPGAGAGRSPLVWAGAALGALLAAGSGAYTVVLIAAVAAFAWPGAAARLRARWAVEWRPVALAAGLTFVLGATAFLSAPTGLAAAGDLLGGWVRNLAPGLGVAYSPFDILLRLLIAEPLLVGFGLGGLALAVRRGAAFGRLAGLGAGLALLVSLIGVGRHPADLGLVALGLILLAGPAMAWTLSAAWSWRGELDPWLLLALSVVLLASAALSLPSYYAAADAAHKALFLGVGVGTALLFVALWLVYGMWGSWPVVGRALPALALFVGGIWSLSQLVGLNYAVDPVQRVAVLLDEPAPGWGDLRTALRDLSALSGGGAREGRIDLLLPAAQNDPLTPVLRWELRDYPALRAVTDVPSDPAPLILAPAEARPALGSSYSGEGFTLMEQWRPESLGAFEQWLRWVVYRQAATAPERSWQVVLWVNRTLIGGAAQGAGEAVPSLPAASDAPAQPQ